MLGNAGDSLLTGNASADTLDGGAGNDMIIADGLSDYFNGGEGDDVILLGGTSLADILALFGASG